MRSWTSVELLVDARSCGMEGLTVVDGEHTGTGYTTENVGTSTLEEGSDTLSSHDLLGGIERALVLDGLQNAVREIQKVSA
jgi:hypothetical protein